MKNKKGFSTIELLVAFLIMALLLGIGVVSYRFIIDRVASSYYDTLEEELLLAGSDYFTNHREDKPLSGYSAVYIDELVGDKYIETLKDRNGNVCSASNDSKVYIYKTEEGYGYEACLVCNDYKSEGTYCDGVALGVINISAVKEDGTSYNPLLSYENNSWSNSDVTVTFGVNVPVTKFVITNTKNGTRSECTNINNQSCSMIFNETSTYNVKAYNEGMEVAPGKGFNVKIDKTSPLCEFVSGPSPSVIDKNSTSTYVLSCTDSNGFSDYSISNSDLSPSTSGVLSVQNPSEQSITNGYRYTIVVTGTSGGNAKLTLAAGAVKDKAGNGNASIASDYLQINTDDEAPNISYNLAAGTYTTDKSVSVTVTDNKQIALISYKLYKDGTLVTSGNPTITSNTSVSFSNSLNSNGTWKLDVTAVDSEGNEKTATRSFTISKDEEAPKVSYSLSGSIVYTENKTVVVTITDNRQLSSVSYKLYKDNTLISSGSPTITSSTSVVFNKDLDSNGVWKLDVTAIDASGNTTNSSRNFEIQVDSQAPTISYSLASGTYQENKSVTVTVTDDNKLNSVEYTLYKNGVVVSNESPTITSNTTVSFSKDLNSDGVWTLDVVATDDSGNETEASRSFTINKDDDDPVISYDLAAGTYEAYKTVNVTVTDNKQLVSVEYSLYKNGTLITLGDPTITNSSSVSFSNSLNSNGTWKLDVTATDANGNTSTATRTYVINRDNEAPNISYDLAAGTYETYKTVNVIVTDNKKLSSIEYKLYKNGALISSGNPTITSNTRVTFGNSLNSNGTWKLDVSATDANGNTTSVTRSFTIDKDTDGPVITYDLSSGTYTSNRTVNVTVTDNEKLSSVKYKLYKGSVEVSSGSPSITSNTSVSFSNSLNSDGVWKIEVEASDDTGNITTSSRTFTIDKAPTCSFVSGPSSSLIGKNKTATYVIECTDVIGFSDYSISASDITLSTSSVVTIQSPTSSSITNGYRYTITVTGNMSGTTSLTLKSSAVTDKAGSGNSSITSDSITVDASGPKISYSLAQGMYISTKEFTTTVEDDSKLKSVSYKLYKDDVVVSSGSPSITTDKSVTFDNSLNSEGVWKIEVTASDEAGNTTSSSRTFTIDKAPTCSFVSGPSQKLVGKNKTATYVIECTDTIGFSDDYKISASDITLSTAGVVSIQEPSITSITNGYRYTVTVTGNVSGSTFLKVAYGTIKDSSGTVNSNFSSSSITVDAESPQISYNLAAGTYEENKTVTVTVTDNRKISSISYKLYKDGSLVSSGNPTISSNTSVSFSNSLNSDGVWKLDVTATDEAGNEISTSRSFTIDAAPSCEWVQIDSSSPNNCTAVAKPSNPTAGNTYVECSDLQYGDWRYYCPTVKCAEGTIISAGSQLRSEYMYSSSAVALNMARNAWGVAESICNASPEGYANSSDWYGSCVAQQLTYYYKTTYEYQCEE